MYLGIPLCINVVAWSCTPESFDFKPNSDFKSNSDFKPNSNDTMASDVYLLQLFVYPFQNPKIHTLQLHYKSSNQNIKDPNTIQLAKYLNIVATISVYHSAVDYLSLVLRSEFFISHCSLLLLLQKRKLWWCTLSTISRQVFLLPFTTRRPRNFSG